MHIAKTVGIADITIDSTHSRAICDEVGWRLRGVLAADKTDVPSYLMALLDRFLELDERIESPPLAPESSPDDVRHLAFADTTAH